MKGFNIFLIVVIFLLAGVSALFSYFLFEKRDQLVAGWGLMSEDIAATAKALDAGSGTVFAQELTPAALGHVNFKSHAMLENDFKPLLDKLLKLAGNVASERDTLAKALQSIGLTLEMNGLSVESLQKLESYESAAGGVVSRAQSYKRQQDDVLNKLCATARTLGATISAAQLKSSGYATAYAVFSKRVDFWRTRHNDFVRAFGDIARNIGSASPSLSGDIYGSALNKLAADAATLKQHDSKVTRELAAEQRKTQQLEQKVRELEGTVESLKAKIKKQDLELTQLCAVLGLSGYREPMADGSVEARRKVEAQVMSIDSKFGFVVVSIGSQSKIEEPFGNRTHLVDPKIPENAVMTVSRGLEDGRPRFVCKIKLVKVNDLCSVGEIIPVAGEQRPKVGDTVYLDTADIAALGK